MRLATGFLMFTIGVVMLAWELVLLHEKLVPISVVMKDAALHSCLLPFGWGLMGAHWWANWDIVDRRAPFEAWPVWVSMAIVLALWDTATGIWMPERDKWPAWLRVARYPGLWLVVGTIAGPFTWPQRAKL